MTAARPGWLLSATLLLALSAVPMLSLHAADAPAVRLQDVDLRAFIQDVSRATGITFIVDTRVQGTVNVARAQAMSEQDLLGMLLAVLRANGLIAVSSGPSTYRIIPDDTAAQQPASAANGNLGFATQVFTLQRVDARSAAEILKPLIGRGGVIMAMPQGNSLLIADYADNLRRVRGLVAQIDTDRAAIDTVSLRNSSAQELARTLTSLFGQAGERSNVLSVLPVESSNSLIVRGDPALVQRVVRTAVDLDGRAERRGDVSVVRLQHASAEQLLPVLQQLVGQTPGNEAQPGQDTRSNAVDVAAAAAGAAQTQVITPAAGKRPVIVRYPGSNALIINADPETQRALMDVIRQLDVHREQVLVEAIVVEISDTAAKRLGVQLLLAGRNGTVPLIATQYSGAAPGIVPLAAAAAGTRSNNGDDDSVLEQARNVAAQSLLGLSGGLIGLAGQSNDAVFGMIIDAVKSDTGSNLLSTPSIMTLDNEQARILVGQEVPITTGEVLGAANDNPFRTIQRQDVGVELEVRPQINTAGGITLAIKQEVSAIAGPVSAQSSELVFNKRQIETRVVVENGAIVALGGLLDQNDRQTVEKVPLLGDVPGLGALFRHKSRNRDKTNLMVFIRPTIIRDAADAQRMTAPRYTYLRDRQLADGDPEAALDALVRDYLRAQPPQLPAAPSSAVPSPATTPAPGARPAQR
ncbi:type II secretion system secretin GspD [Xanthomonas arboricola pv. corylina]|uniref:Secretin GspD 2 n=1 Tax=Xanthomonas arboricola pv. corylina TaxID=487821 RepID=A0A2S7CKJ9_9XANT|nr:type II secretion system secretin GspD [Xanthomonas arboricola]MDN0203614.1 type II secretion system secretin GspD [Xanthomonas arboricola pv. corylina]MDN0207542.1 type II secretion system secretin GspD [Xanthomonas arboricola pv. corylina]MDN0211914.1 type II secretion system secretin GspD [Xanthomonas arboricola pv. corylina]MDN0215516.1 type II secretion system secretin GspD [Xanthomonas arboricola pv. corylina]PPU17316.1 type II secretion system protein GspD [Xanthomonas arboricola pv.